VRIRERRVVVELDEEKYWFHFLSLVSIIAFMLYGILAVLMPNLRASISTMRNRAKSSTTESGSSPSSSTSRYEDLQELGDQERRGAEHRRRDDRAEAAGREQPPAASCRSRP